jgi:hypothetical protein
MQRSFFGLAKTRARPSTPTAQRAGSREPPQGEGLVRLSEETHGADIPTTRNSPYSMRSSKCRTTNASVLEIEIASASRAAVLNATSGRRHPSARRSGSGSCPSSAFVLTHSSSASRFTAGASAFFILSQSSEPRNGRRSLSLIRR